MILNDKDVEKRLNSPMNLINQLKNITSKKNNAMALFGIGKKIERSFVTIEPKAQPEEPPIPIEPDPDLDTILKNNESQIKLGLAHDKALDLLHRSVDMLSNKLDDVSPSKLPSVISAASKTVESIRKERLEASKNAKDQQVHLHFYTPEQKKLSDYEIIDIQGA